MKIYRPDTWRKFFQQSRGATAVEFAIISVPLLAIILSIIQIGLVFFLNAAIQTLAEQVSRTIMTGSVQSQNLSQTQFNAAVCQAAPGIFKNSGCSGLMVDVESYPSFSVVPTASPTINYNGAGQATNVWTYSPGNPGDIVIVRVMYDWPIYGGPLGVLLSNQSNGTRLLVGTTVLKNEP